MLFLIEMIFQQMGQQYLAKCLFEPRVISYLAGFFFF